MHDPIQNHPEKEKMKLIGSLIVLSCLSTFAVTETSAYRHGTIVRMSTGDCRGLRRGFVSLMGGGQPQNAEELCPEYTLVSNEVVFVIVGRGSNKVLPLAEVTEFRFSNDQLAVRLSESKEVKFTIKEMLLRSDWELMQKPLETASSTQKPVKMPFAATGE